MLSPIVRDVQRQRCSNVVTEMDQWSLQNRAHRAHGPVGVETQMCPAGWVAHPEISGCQPHTAHFSSIFPASSYFPAVFTCVQPTGSVDLLSAVVGRWATLPESSRSNSSGLSSSEEHEISLLVQNAIHFNYVSVREGGFYTRQA